MVVVVLSNKALFFEFVSYFVVRKKFFLLPVIALLLLSSLFVVSAETTTSNALYYTMDDDYMSGSTVINALGFTFVNATESSTSSVAGKFGEARYMDANTDYIEVPDSATYDGSNTLTVGGWYKGNDTNDEATLAFKSGAAGNYQWLIYHGSATQYVVCSPQSSAGGGVAAAIYSTTIYNNTWVHIICTVEDTVRTRLYINGVNVANSSSWSGIWQKDAAATMRLGDGSYKPDGKIGLYDEWYLWQNRLLTTAEINELYEASRYTADVTYDPTVRVFAYDYYDNSSVSDFTVTLTNGTSFVTTNGTVYLRNVSIGNYTFNVTYPDYFNTTNDITVNAAANDTVYDRLVYPYQSRFNFTVSELVTNDSLSGVSFYVNGSANDTQFLKAGSNYELVAVKSGYYNLTHYFNVSALDNTTINLTGMYNAQVMISPRDILNNNTISGANITLYNSSYGYITSVTGVTNYTFNLTAGVYLLSVSAPNRTSYVVNVTVSDGQVYYAYMYAYNSLWVYAFRQADSVAIQNFNVSVSNATHEYTGNGSLGVARLSLIPSGNYDVIVSATGYTSASYVIVMTDNSFQTLNAFLSASTDTFIFTVKDKSTNGLIEGATIVQKRFINSTLTTVGSETTDITGRVQFNYENGIEYTFVASINGYETKTFVLEVLFDTYTLLLTPEQTVNETIFVDDVYYLNNGYSFVNYTSWISYSFISPLGSLEIYSLELILPNGTSSIVSGSNALGGSLNVSVDSSSVVFGDTAVVVITYKSSLNANNKSVTKTFAFLDYVPASGSAPDFKADLSGLGDWEKVFWGSLLVIIIIGVFSGVGFFIGDALLIGSIGGIVGFSVIAYFGFINMVVASISIFIFMIFIIGRMVNR